MVGMVYVLKWNVNTFDEDALVSVSDLGQAAETSSLSGLSHADGKIFVRTMKEMISIGEQVNCSSVENWKPAYNHNGNGLSKNSTFQFLGRMLLKITFIS